MHSAAKKSELISMNSATSRPNFFDLHRANVTANNRWILVEQRNYIRGSKAWCGSSGRRVRCHILM